MDRATTSAFLAAACVGVGLAIALFSATPFVVHQLFPRHEPDAAILSSRLTSRYAGPAIQVAPMITIHVPTQEIRISNGQALSISITKTWLGHEDMMGGSPNFVTSDAPMHWDTDDVERPFSVSLSVSKGFSTIPREQRISKSFSHPALLDGQVLTWYWIITADLVGEHHVLVEGLPLQTYPLRWDTENATEQNSLPDFAKVRPDGTLDLTIGVLTPMGLTQQQDALLKTINASVSFLGVLLAYPLFKRYFEVKADERPASNTAKRRRRKRRDNRSGADVHTNH